MKEALFWKHLEDGSIRCQLCPHECVISEGGDGHCRVRGVRQGCLQCLVYGGLAALHLDPIEKKPLYHFHPGGRILSLGTPGCNLSCAFCQNWQISQTSIASHNMLPEDLVDAARSQGSVGLAYTYSEPLVAYEFVLDCARMAMDLGLKNVLVTNGFIQPKPLDMLLEWIHAANVDLKSIRDSFYREICGGSLAPVQRTIKTMKRRIHLELTHLMVTGKTDSEKDLREMVDWIAGELGEDTPLHLSRYFPQYHFTVPETSLDRLVHGYELAKEKLTYVYIGNASPPGLDATNTICPGCGALAIERKSYRIHTLGLSQRGSCANCGNPIAVVH